MIESIYKTDTEKKFLELFEAALKDVPYRIVDLDCRLGGKSLLRLFIERTTGEGISVGDCAQVSHLLDPVIEASLIFSGPYELEVSSPGLDRRLRLKLDFEKVVGTELKLEFLEKIEKLGGATRGVLLGVDEKGLSVKADGRQVLVCLGNVKKAQAVFSEVNKRV